MVSKGEGMKIDMTALGTVRKRNRGAREEAMVALIKYIAAGRRKVIVAVGSEAYGAAMKKCFTDHELEVIEFRVIEGGYEG
jgi:hypothetical protein